MTPGNGKGYLVLFRSFLREHSGNHNNIGEVVCNMSPAFLAAIGDGFPGANVILDWFHIAQLFTTIVNEVRKAKATERKLPKATRWAMLKAADGGRLTEQRQQALTDTAWRLKKMLRWTRKATSVRVAQRRHPLHPLCPEVQCIVPDTKALAPVLKALMTLE